MILPFHYVIPCVGMQPQRWPETDRTAPIQVRCIIPDRLPEPGPRNNLVLVLDTQHNESASVTNSLHTLMPRLRADLKKAGHEPTSNWTFVQIDTIGGVDIIDTQPVPGSEFLGWKPYGDRRLLTLLGDIEVAHGVAVVREIDDWVAEHGYWPMRAQRR